MADHPVTATETGAYSIALVADVESTVTFDRHCPFLRVMTEDAGAEVWFRTDNVAAVVGDAECDRVRAISGDYIDVDVTEGGNTTVSLIADDAVVVSVIGSF